MSTHTDSKYVLLIGSTDLVFHSRCVHTHVIWTVLQMLLTHVSGVLMGLELLVSWFRKNDWTIFTMDLSVI